MFNSPSDDFIAVEWTQTHNDIILQLNRTINDDMNKLCV